MAKSGIVDRDLGWKDIKKELKKLKKMGVKAGIVEGHHISNNGANIAEYALYNEVGTDNGHIPARPFIRSWVDNNKEQINRTMDSAYNHVVKGKWTAEDAMKRIGEFAESGIRDNIIRGDFEPNKPATIKKKGSDKPLVDIGTMRKAIRYEVVKKK